MKKHILALILLTIGFNNALAQDAAEIYTRTVGSTVTIETDNGIGSGFFVAEHLIATNYHVIEGASVAHCYTNNSTVKYEIKGYSAINKPADLILLSVPELTRPALKLSANDVIPGQKVYALGSPKGLPATISDGIVSGLRDFDGQRLIQITAPISPGSSGGPVLNSSGEVIGISVGQYADGQNLNFAIPSQILEDLLIHQFDDDHSIPSLIPEITKDEQYGTNYYSKDRTLEIGILKKDNPNLSLDYLTHAGNQTIFFFTYHHNSENETSQKIWLGDYKLIDLDNGKVYYSKSTDLPGEKDPRIVYNGTKTGFHVSFERLPPGLDRFSLIEGDCSTGAFCFLNLDIRTFRESDSFEPHFYTKTETEGTVSFFSYYGGSGDIKVFIEDVFIGELEQYYSDRTYTPDCGESGTLSIRLNAGTYRYRAEDSQNTWQGEFIIRPNQCSIKGLTKN